MFETFLLWNHSIIEFWILVPVGGQKARVKFDYVAQAPNQISIRIGQVLNLISYGGPGSWSKAEELGTGIYNSQEGISTVYI